ncbi:hypothetical protein ACFYT4_16380 [Streptomyces sp. NPDC004609]|uniref:hypothetical protein n=1 Tax=Streptomyces sp. NPDC004609 TaxID=3364704 RepID=UPI0036C9BA6A
MTTTSAPPVWFRLPPGYHSLDGIDLAEFEQSVSAVLMPMLEGTELRGQALRDAHTLVDLFAALRESENVHTSVGVHPEGDNGSCVSFFSLSVTEIASRTAALAVAQCALAQANSPRWSTNTGRLLKLPGDVPAALVAGTLMPPSPGSLEERGVTAPPVEVFQARLTVPCPTNVHVVVADLTSAATRHAEAYSSILEGIARTMSFIDPVESAGPVRRPSRILELFS